MWLDWFGCLTTAVLQETVRLISFLAQLWMVEPQTISASGGQLQLSLPIEIHAVRLNILPNVSCISCPAFARSKLNHLGSHTFRHLYEKENIEVQHLSRLFADSWYWTTAVFIWLHKELYKAVLRDQLSYLNYSIKEKRKFRTREEIYTC